MPHFECLACKTRLHNTAKPKPIRSGIMPVYGSLSEPVGDLSEIVRVPRSRVMRRHVAPRRIRGRAADRRRGRRDHRSTRVGARTSPARNRKLRRSLSHPTSPSLSSRAPGSGDEAVRHRRRAPTPAAPPRLPPVLGAFDAARHRRERRRQTNVRTSRSAAGQAATWAGLSHAG